MTPTTAACGFYRPGTTRTDELPTIRAEVTDALTATLTDTPIHQQWRLCWTPTFTGIELVVAIPASLATADSLTLFADTITAHGFRPLTPAERDDIVPRAVEQLSTS